MQILLDPSYDRLVLVYEYDGKIDVFLCRRDILYCSSCLLYYLGMMAGFSSMHQFFAKVGRQNKAQER